MVYNQAMENHKKSMKKLNLEEFGNLVSAYRADLGISAYELSVRIGRDVSYISKLEKGKLNPTLETLYNLCDALNITMSEFFKYYDE